MMNNNWRHLCVDMQRLFNEDTPWHVDWMRRVLPQVERVVSIAPEHTIFTRFIPPVRADDMPGTWKAYYVKWAEMTREHLAPELLDILPELQRFSPPALVFDKPVYSPWLDGRLHAHLKRQEVDTLVISGGETDVCVMAAVLGAIDLGYRTVLLSNAVCSSADETHDASLELFSSRFSMQLDIMECGEWLDRLAATAA